MTDEYTFNTTPGETVDRELLIACLNIGTAEKPMWKILGKRVEESALEFDWSTETKRDILGNVHSTMKKPIKTQTFEPCELDSEDKAQEYIWNLAVVQENVRKLCNMDMLIIHSYADFAERYSSCMIAPSSLSGEGGGATGMPIDVTYGGTRTIGNATKDDSGDITFTPAA